MQENFWDCVLTTLSSIGGFLNNGFFSALAGAAFGAFTAQYIAKKHLQAELTLQEIKSTNAAILLAFSMANSFIVLKGQQILPLKIEYDEKKDRHNRYLERKKADEESHFNYEANLIDVLLPSLPIEIIANIIYEKITASKQLIVTISVLQQNIVSLTEVTQRRHNIILDYISNRDLTERQKVAIYFGTDDGNGKIDTSYPDSIANTFRFVDECILFAKSAGEELHEHGCRLAKKYGRNSPKIHSVWKFEKAFTANLMPDEKNHNSWVEQFQQDEDAN